MANAIKKLTFILVPLTVLFFVTTFIAGNAEHTGGFYSALTICANILLVVLPILFVVTLGLGMAVMLKVIMSSQMRTVGRKPLEKLPMAHFIACIICFVLYFIFIYNIFSTGA